MYIAAASLARGNIDATPYFSAPLSSHLPHAASIAMTDRSATAKFASMQSHALNTITETGGDWAVLRTKWTWSATVTDTRNWVEGIVLNSGLGLGAALATDLEQDADREDSPVFGDRELSAGGDVFGTPIALTEAPSQQPAAIAPVAETHEAPTTEEDAESDLLIVEEVEQLEVVQVAEEIEEDADDDEGDDSDSRRSANKNVRNSAEDEDDQLDSAQERETWKAPVGSSARHSPSVQEEVGSSLVHGNESPVSDDASLDDAAEA